MNDLTEFEEEFNKKLSIVDNKEQIIKIFNENIRDKEIDCIKRHCGSEGHWLEDKFGIKPNSKNEPDLLGYELKKNSKKITFGDFSATEYLFSKTKDFIDNFNSEKIEITRYEFIKLFGSPNPKKNNRFSWSGSCVPKNNEWNSFGQKIYFDENNNLIIKYSFDNDKRENKDFILESIKTKKEIMIAFWKNENLENKINSKFNKNGFFICKKENNKYNKICFGKAFNFLYFVKEFNKGNIFFDSGMYSGNSRNYSQFRAYSNSFWENLIVEEL